MIVVLGATGHLGSKVSNKLAEKNVPFRGIASPASPVKSPEFLTGDLMDGNFLREILSEATTLFSILPVNLYPIWNEYASLLTAVLAEKNQVTHLVNISNAVTEKDGTPTLLINFETELNKLSGINIKHLRCANFFDNLNWGLNNGYNGDLKLPYISTHEIALVAAGLLIDKNFSAHSFDELLGPEDYSMDDFASLAGKGSRKKVLTDEARPFFEPFNTGSFSIPPRTINNTTSDSDPRFYLAHFLKTEFRDPDDII